VAASDDLALPAGLAAGVPQITDDKALQPKPSATSKMIDIAQVQGQVHAQSVQKVGDLADRNPNETVAIVRQWLHEQPA
jgi:flagellar M-ring protein FliF